MSIRAAHPPQIPAQPGVTYRRLDVTVSDQGVQQRVQVAAAPEPAASPSTRERVLTEASATLPSQAVIGPGVYDPRGRTPRMPVEAQNGRLLDITG